jgi:CheY-like chemotaxis protein
MTNLGSQVAERITNVHYTEKDRKRTSHSLRGLSHRSGIGMDNYCQMLNGDSHNFTEYTLLKILLIAKDFIRFSPLAAGLQREQTVQVIFASTSASGLESLKDQAIDLIIVDEMLNDMCGIDCIKQCVMLHPLVNTALVSKLDAEAFHEATEGLGILTQLPSQPQESDGVALFAVLAKIAMLMGEKGTS